MTARLPLLPLGTVLFPGLVLPLTLFEERYLALARDLLAQPEDSSRRFGVVAIRSGSEVAPTGPRGTVRGPTAGLGPDLHTALYAVGCTAEVAALRSKDGGYRLVATGTVRFRVHSIDASGPYLVGEVEELPEEPGEGAGTLAAGVDRAFTAYQRQLAKARERTAVSADQERPEQPSVLSYLVAAAVVAELPVKQQLLEAPDTAARLRAELALLRRETAVIGRLPSLPAADLARGPAHHN